MNALSTLSRIVTSTTAALAILTLTSLSSYCQPGTRTQSDSLVLLPKNLVIYMLQDLVQADSDRVELRLSNEQILNQQEFILQQTELIMTQQERHKKCIDLNMMVEEDRDSLAVITMTQERQISDLTKSRRQWRLASLGQSLLLLLILL